MSASEANPSLLQSQGVHLISDFVSKCGLSQSARDTGETIRHLQLPCERLDLPIFGERETEKREQLLNPRELSEPASRLSILSFNADLLPAVARTLPRSFFEDRYIVGIWFWETEDFPPNHALGFGYVDEVWVASRHIQRALEKISPVPVRLYPHLVHPPRPFDPAALPAFLKNDRFVFLFCYDFRSMAERKNPAGLCEAFIRAFPEPLPEGPLCILKSAGTLPDHLLEFLDLKRRFHHRPDIIFMDGWLTTEERDSLMNRANCYASLHRAEGLGLTLLESMSLGKPCITTAYSGNMDFSTPDNSWLIPYRMIPVGPHRWPFHRDQVWADPDVAAAAAAMREAVENPLLLREKGENARRTAAQNHSLDACAAAFRPLLEQAMARPARAKPAIDAVGLSGPVKSSRNQAYETLRLAKASQKQARRKVKDLKGIRVAPGLKTILENILEIQKLQQQSQKLILDALGDFKKQTRGFDGHAFESLLLDQKRTTQLIGDLTAGLRQD